MASSSRKKQTPKLDSTILRHQVEKYFNELQEDTSLEERPLDMDFLNIKRKPLSTPTTNQFPYVDHTVAKKIRFDASLASNASILERSSDFTRDPSMVTKCVEMKVLKENNSELQVKLSNREAEIVDLQQKIILLEMKMNDMKTARDKIESALAANSENFKVKIQQAEDKIEDLRCEVKHLQAKNSELSKEVLERKMLTEKMKINLTEEKLNCSKRIVEVEQAMFDMQNEYEPKIESLKQELEVTVNELEKARLEAEEARNQLKVQKVIPPCDHLTVIEQQRQVILEMENALFTQRSAFSQSQEAKLARIPQMEKELSHLRQVNQLYRETAANELLLKEKISSLTESLQRSQEQCAIVSTLENEIKLLQKKIKEWEDQAQLLFNAATIAQVTEGVNELRRRELKLVDDLGSMEVEFNSLKRTHAALVTQHEKLKDQIQKKGQSESEDKQRIGRLERKLHLTQMDRNHYRSIVESYEKDITNVGGNALISAELNRVHELEQLLEEYRQLLSSSEAKPADNSDTVAQLNKEKEQHIQQIKELNKTIAEMKSQLDIVSLRGQSLPSDTKVLHFVNNPLDVHRKKMFDTISQLEKDNAALRERVRLMEEGHSQNLTLLVGEKFDQGFTPERFKELEEMLKREELKRQRLEEVFKKYGSDFRKGIFHLFGYQVDCDESGNFKLISTYAESTSDNLHFKLSGDGLILMDTPFIHTIDDLVQLHINTQDSIPVFLSSLTINLFSRQSMLNSTVEPST